jgi:signal transduction histidine kinase
MLQDSSREEDRTRFMQSMNSDIDELDQLVAELLTYARFDRDRPELTFQRQEIEPWLRDAVRQAAMGKDDLRIEFDVSGHELKHARFDPLLMARALSNLLENAARYAQTRVQVIFSSDDDCFRLIVDDDGPGIPEQERETVFNAFKRLDSSRGRGTGGYGLGLAIAQRISEWHGGEISVVDSPLGGARFKIRWPQEQPDQD